MLACLRSTIYRWELPARTPSCVFRNGSRSPTRSRIDRSEKGRWYRVSAGYRRGDRYGFAKDLPQDACAAAPADRLGFRHRAGEAGPTSRGAGGAASAGADDRALGLGCRCGSREQFGAHSKRPCSRRVRGRPEGSDGSGRLPSATPTTKAHSSRGRGRDVCTRPRARGSGGRASNTGKRASRPFGGF